MAEKQALLADLAGLAFQSPSTAAWELGTHFGDPKQVPAS